MPRLVGRRVYVEVLSREAIDDAGVNATLITQIMMFSRAIHTLLASY
jgi:hypothetical protein